jgi:hypothetical protein
LRCTVLESVSEYETAGRVKHTVNAVHNALVVLPHVQKLVRIGKKLLLLGLGVWFRVVGYGS